MATPKRPREALVWRQEHGRLRAYKPFKETSPMRLQGRLHNAVEILYAEVRYVHDIGWRVATNDWNATDMVVETSGEATRMVNAMWELDN